MPGNGAAGRSRSGGVILALLAAATLLAACGKSGPSDEQQVRTALTRFGAAVAARDYATICQQLLAPSLTVQLTQIGLPCEQALAKGFGTAQSPTLAVRTVKVSGPHAVAVVHTTAANQAPSDDTVDLAKLGGAWRISALGATPLSK